MANLTTTRMAVILPAANVKKFLKYFGAYAPHFHRTTLNSSEVIESRNGKTLLMIDCSCDWSFQYSLYDPNTNNPDVIGLKQACSECGVSKISVRSEEESSSFYEFLNYDEDDAFWDYEVLDRPRNPEDLYLDEEDDE